MEKTWFYSTKPSQNDWWQCQQREKWEYQNKLFSSMTALVLTTTTFTLERKKIFGSFFTATNELLLGLVDEKLTSFQYPLAFFASIPHYRSTPLREVSISMGCRLKQDQYSYLTMVVGDSRCQFKGSLTQQRVLVTCCKQCPIPPTGC